MAEEIGVGYVRLVPSMRGFAKAATRELKSALAGPSRKAGEDAGDEAGAGFSQRFGSSLKSGLSSMGNPLADALSGKASDAGEDAGGRYADGLHRGMGDGGDKSGKSWLAGFGASLGGGGGGLGEKFAKSFTGMFAISAKTAATAFSAQFVGSVVAALASGAAKLAHGLGAMVALLPAAAMAGVTAMVALKLAVAGVGDALTAAVTGDAKEFDEAIKGLAPSARGFAREVRGMRTEIKGLQQSVQQSFFEKFAGDTKKLGGTYLPMVRSALSGVAASFGKAVHESAGFLNMPETSGKLAMALGHVRGAIGNVAGALPSVVRAFVPLITVGSTFLPKLTSGLKHAAEALANMAQSGEKSGGIADFIQGGIDKLKGLWETAKQVGRVIGNVFDIFQQFRGTGGIFDALGIKTGGLLDKFEQLTVKAKTFFQSAEGGAAITEIFKIIQSLLSATMGTLAHVASMVGRIFAPLLPQMSKFAESTANFQLKLADGLAPALEAVANAMGTILPIASSFLDVMASNKTVMAGLAGVVVGLYAAWKAGAIAAKIAQSNFNLTAGGATAAVAGLVMASKQIEAANEAKALEEMAEGFAAINFEATAAAKTAILHAESMGLLDEAFAKVEQSGGGASAKFVELMEAAGVADDTVAKYRREVEQAAAAQDNQTSAIQRTADALRAQNDPVFAAISAQASLAEAQAAINTATAEYGANSPQVVAAHVAAAEAAGRQDAALLALQGAVESGDLSVEGFRSTLARWVQQGAITQHDADITMMKFMGVSSAAKSVPTSVQSRVSAQDYATAAIEGIRARLDGIDGHNANVSITARAIFGPGIDLVTRLGGFGGATGGIVPQYLATGGLSRGPKGSDTVPAWLTPGEMILTKAQQAQLWSIANGTLRGGNQSSDGDDATMSKLERTVRAAVVDFASVGVSRATPAPARMVVDVTGGPPEMVRLIKKMIRTDGHGDPVAYLTP